MTACAASPVCCLREWRNRPHEARIRGTNRRIETSFKHGGFEQISRHQRIAFGSSEETDGLIERLKRLFGRSDPSDDLISAYVDSTDEAEPDRMEEMLRASGVDVDDARSVRETSRLLRSVDTVEAPRSYALTPDSLAERGYSDREIEKILDPRRSMGRLRLRNAGVYVPLAIAAVALVGVALITIGDLSEYVTDRFEGASEAAAGTLGFGGETVVQTVVVEKQVFVEGERMAMEVPAASSAPGEPGAPGDLGKPAEPGVPGPPELMPGSAGEPVVQTVLVEKEVVVTVVVEKEVEVAGETVVQTVAVVVEREVVVEKEVKVTVVVEKVVEVEKIVEKEVVKEVEVAMEVEVEKEVMVEAEPAPTATPAAAMTKAAAPMQDSAAEESLKPPKESPCAIIPTPASKPTTSPEIATTPEPTPTMLPIPTCTPTPTPTSTATATPTSTPSPSPTP